MAEQSLNISQNTAEQVHQGHKARLLYVLKVPPPLHGSSMMNKQVADSVLLQTSFNSRILPMRFSKSVDDIGKIYAGKIFIWFGFVWQLLGLLYSFRPQLVYFALSSRGAAFYKDAAMVAMIKLFGVPIVYHLHARGFAETAGKNALAGVICRFVFRGTDVICLSSQVADDLEGVHKGKIHVMPNGVPDFAGNGILGRKPVNKVPRLLFLSNLIECKGVIDFIRALGIINSKGLVFEADIIGQPKDVSIERAQNLLSELGLEQVVKLHGGMYGEEKAKMLVNADVFVFPTRYNNEAFPLVLLEAMQNGIAVIANRWAAIPEILAEGKAGLLTIPADIEDLSLALSLLIGNSELMRSLQAEGRKRYENLYTLPSFENNLKNLLMEISARGRAVKGQNV